MTQEHEYTLQNFAETFSALTGIASDMTREQIEEEILIAYDKLSEEDHHKLDAISLDLYQHHFSDLPCSWIYDWMQESVLNELYAREQTHCVVCGELNHVRWNTETKKYELV